MNHTAERHADEIERKRAAEYGATLARVLAGDACPARMSGTQGMLNGMPVLVCGREPEGNISGRLKHPGSVGAFCEYHMDKLQKWATGAARDTDEELWDLFGRRKAERERKEADRRQRQRDRQSVVYFIRIPGDRIKIGRSCRLRERLNTHRRTFGEVEFLLTIPGSKDVEAETHRRFAAHLVDGEHEIFLADPELLAWIERRQKQETAS